jgi:integration host factor subunit alpha
MTKKNITKNIKQNTRIKDHDALKITDAFIKLIKLNLHHNIIVKISGFGSFYTKNSVQRIGRNPLTKEEFIIPSTKKTVFQTSNKVKKKIN